MIVKHTFHIGAVPSCIMQNLFPTYKQGYHMRIRCGDGHS